MDKITIDRETAEQAANALLDLPLRTDREVIAEALRAALAAQPAEPVALDNACTTEQAIDEYLSDYTMEGDSGSHTPDESELLVIKDAIMGLLVYPDFLASFAQSDPAAVPPDERVRVLRELVVRALALCGSVAEQQARSDDSWEAEAAAILADMEATQ